MYRHYIPRRKVGAFKRGHTSADLISNGGLGFFDEIFLVCSVAKGSHFGLFTVAKPIIFRLPAFERDGLQFDFVVRHFVGAVTEGLHGRKKPINQLIN